MILGSGFEHGNRGESQICQPFRAMKFMGFPIFYSKGMGKMGNDGVFFKLDDGV